MGYGSYSASDWQKLKSSRKLSNGQRVEEVFTRRECDPKMNPKFIGTRECDGIHGVSCGGTGNGSLK